MAIAPFRHSTSTVLDSDQDFVVWYSSQIAECQDDPGELIGLLEGLDRPLNVGATDNLLVAIRNVLNNADLHEAHVAAACALIRISSTPDIDESINDILIACLRNGDPDDRLHVCEAILTYPAAFRNNNALLEALIKNANCCSSDIELKRTAVACLVSAHDNQAVVDFVKLLAKSDQPEPVKREAAGLLKLWGKKVSSRVTVAAGHRKAI